MILAAGYGTRLRPITNSIPKALVKINNQTLLEIVIQRLKSFGINEIIINVHHFADQIIQFIETKNAFGIRIEISKEDTLLDTGGGLKKAAWFFDSDEPFLLHNVDVLSNLDILHLAKFHQEKKALVTLATRHRDTTRYLLIDSENNYCGWESIRINQKEIVRKPIGKLSRISFMGIHFISPKLLQLLPPENIFPIISAYSNLAQDSKIKSMSCDEYLWLDVGKQEELQKADDFLSNIN